MPWCKYWYYNNILHVLIHISKHLLTEAKQLTKSWCNWLQVSRVTVWSLAPSPPESCLLRANNKAAGATVLTGIRSSCYLFYTNYSHVCGAALPSRLKLSSEPEEGCKKTVGRSTDLPGLSCSHYVAFSHFPFTPRSKVQTPREISSRGIPARQSASSWPVCDHTFRFRLESHHK